MSASAQDSDPGAPTATAPNDDQPSPRDELERLSAQLSSRQSTDCFAVALAACAVSLILGGIAVRLALESRGLSTVFWVLSLAFAGSTATALIAFRRGWQRLAVERSELERLLALREELGVDQRGAVRL